MTFSRAAARNRDHNVFNSCCPYLVVVTLQSCRQEYNSSRERCVIYDIDRRVRRNGGRISSTRVKFEVRLGKKWRAFLWMIVILESWKFLSDILFRVFDLVDLFSSRIIELFLLYPRIVRVHITSREVVKINLLHYNIKCNILSNM